jgi:hypothetical protein
MQRVQHEATTCAKTNGEERIHVLNPLSPSPPSNSEKFVLGDVNVSLIRTARGRTIYVSRIT